MGNDAPFNFDLDRMKHAVESPSYSLPSNLTPDEIIQWMYNITENVDGFKEQFRVI